MFPFHYGFAEKRNPRKGFDMGVSSVALLVAGESFVGSSYACCIVSMVISMKLHLIHNSSLVLLSHSQKAPDCRVVRCGLMGRWGRGGSVAVPHLPPQSFPPKQMESKDEKPETEDLNWTDRRYEAEDAVGVAKTAEEVLGAENREMDTDPRGTINESQSSEDEQVPPMIYVTLNVGGQLVQVPVPGSDAWLKIQRELAAANETAPTEKRKASKPPDLAAIKATKTFDSPAPTESMSSDAAALPEEPTKNDTSLDLLVSLTSKDYNEKTAPGLVYEPPAQVASQPRATDGNAKPLEATDRAEVMNRYCIIQRRETQMTLTCRTTSGKLTKRRSNWQLHCRVVSRSDLLANG